MYKFSEIKIDWIESENRLKRTFIFENFVDSIKFVNKVAEISEYLKHHPTIKIEFNKVKIETTTHDEGSIVTEKDHELCREIDKFF